MGAIAPRGGGAVFYSAARTAVDGGFIFFRGPPPPRAAGRRSGGGISQMEIDEANEIKLRVSGKVLTPTPCTTKVSGPRLDALTSVRMREETMALFSIYGLAIDVVSRLTTVVVGAQTVDIDIANQQAFTAARNDPVVQAALRTLRAALPVAMHGLTAKINATIYGVPEVDADKNFNSLRAVNRVVRLKTSLPMPSADDRHLTLAWQRMAGDLTRSEPSLSAIKRSAVPSSSAYASAAASSAASRAGAPARVWTPAPPPRRDANKFKRGRRN